MKPIRLNDDELNAVLDAVIGAHGVRSGAKICRLLADSPTWTRRVRAICSVGNVNDIVKNNVNPKIEKLGLVIGCSKPFRLFKTPGQRGGGEYLWSFYRIEAANDDGINGIDGISDFDDFDDFDNDPTNPANRPPRSFATAEEAAAAALKDANGPPWAKSWADDLAPGATWTDENIAIYQRMNPGRKGDDK